MAPNDNLITIRLENDEQDKGWRLDDGTYFITYRQEPLDARTLKEVAGLIARFIDLADQLFEPGTTGEEDVVQDELVKARAIGKKLHDWLVEHLPAMRTKLTELSSKDALILSAGPNLMAMPWELLYDGDRFLVQDCPLIRRWPGEAQETDSLQEPFPLPLQILGLSYSSQGLSISADEHWDYVEEGLEQLTAETLAHLRVLAREGELEDELFDFTELRQLPADIGRVDILHILAHGAVPAHEAGSGVIILGGKPFTGQQLASFLLGPLPDVRLLVLASCKSGQTDLRGHLKSVAQACLEAGIPAVVAMRDDISPLAAELFVSGLYRALAEGKSLDQAVLHGRGAVTRISGTIEWATPVLYTTLDELTLFSPLSDEEAKARRRYLELLRLTTDVVPDKIYLPVDVRPAAAITQKSPNLSSEEGAANLPGGAFVYSVPEVQAEKQLDARWALVDPTNGHPLRRVSVLLGEAGSGKTTIIDKVIGVTIPFDEQTGEFSNTQQQAVDPAAYMPLHLHLNAVSVNPQSYQLDSLLRQAMAEVVAVAEERQLNIDTTGFPPDQAAAEMWAGNPAWRFLVLLEGLEAVSPENRREVGTYLRRLIQENPRHCYIFTATSNAFAGFLPHLGQYTQWQIAQLGEQAVRQELRREGVHIDDPELITLLRHPWALITLKRMVGSGTTSFDQASLLRGQIDQILDDEYPFQLQQRYLKQRLSRALAELALEMERGWETRQYEPSLAVDEFFVIVKTIRGERTYDLEEMFAGLVSAGILALDQHDSSENIRFSNPYVHAILAALALNQALKADTRILADFGIADPRLHTTLVLLAQLEDGNVNLIVEELLARLTEVGSDWIERLAILELAVRCLQHNPRAADSSLRKQLIRQLSLCLLQADGEQYLNVWFDESRPGCLGDARLSTGRLPRTSMRVRVAELLGFLRDWHAFEPLRWLVMDRIRFEGEAKSQFARSIVRQAAAESLLQLWRAHVLSEQRLADYPSLYAFLKSWSAIWTEPEKSGLAELDHLIEWLEAQQPAWLSSIAVVPLTTIVLRHTNQSLVDQAMESLIFAFLNSGDDATIWSIAGSGIEAGYQPPGSEIPWRFMKTMLAVLDKTAGNGARSELEKARREAATYALGKLKRPEALNSLYQILTNRTEDFRIQARAARAIGECGLEDRTHRDLPRARQALLDVVGSFRGSRPWHPYPRREAIGSLGHLGGDGVLEVLLAVICDERGNDAERLRAQAVFSLQQLIGLEAAVEHLLNEIPTKPVRGEYARTARLFAALALIGDEKTAQVLVDRDWSQETIEKLGEENWIRELRLMKARRPETLPPKYPGRVLRFLGSQDPEQQMTGPDVYLLHKRLWELGYAITLRIVDGSFSQTTERAVKAFQLKSKGLQPTGVVDVPTWRRLFSTQACQGPGGLLLTDESGFGITFQGTLSLRDVRMVGADVRLVQSYLWDLGYDKQLESISGVFDSRTQQAVITWQAQQGREPTGAIERSDWRALQQQWQQADKLLVRPGKPCP